jgi:mono/diheme cytochrome c family protein
MQRRRKRILLLPVWSLLLGISAVPLSNGIIAAQLSPGGHSDKQAEIEKGREVIGVTCVACHTNILRMLQIHKESPEQWRNTVYSMISRGAEVMPDEIQPLIAFLAANAENERQTGSQISGGRRPGSNKAAPEAEGRAVFQRSCQQCHELATASKKLASEEWNAVIARMMTYGAKLTPAERQELITYLSGLTKASRP